MKPSGELIFGMEAIQETWSRRQGSFEEATRQGGAPPPSWAARDSLDVHSKSIRLLSKNHAPKGFIPFGLHLIFLFFETLK